MTTQNNSANKNKTTSGNDSVSPFLNKNTPEVAKFTDNTSGKVYAFPFNINQLNWSYNLNTQSYSTIGGRVVQLLSVKITTMTIQGEAGSRHALMQLFNDFTTMQDNQNQTKTPMTISVPSRNLSYRVWLENFQMGWDVTTVAYPYVIMLEVDQDLTNVATNAAGFDAVKKIAQGVGFSPEWTGLSSSLSNLRFNDIQSALQSGAVVKNGG
jgi:hypothetical protein